jgi:hypothetical protein
MLDMAAGRTVTQRTSDGTTGQPCKVKRLPRTTCVMLTFIGTQRLDTAGVYALNSRFKEEFGLRHDIKVDRHGCHEKRRFQRCHHGMYSGSAGWNLAPFWLRVRRQALH